MIINDEHSNSNQLITVLQNIEEKLGFRAPVVYMMCFVVFLSVFFTSAHSMRASVFQLLVYIVIFTLIINYTLILRSKIELTLDADLHIVGGAFTLAIICLFIAHTIGCFQLALAFSNMAWVLQICNEIYLQGERYTRMEIGGFIGISLGCILCVWDVSFSIWGVLLGWCTAFFLASGAHNLRRICKTNTLVVYNVVLHYSLILLSILYPIHAFGPIKLEVVFYSLLFGLIAQVFGVLFLRSIQLGQPAIVIALIFASGIIMAVFDLAEAFYMFRALGILITLVFSTFQLFDHKTYINIAGFSVEPEENPYTELKHFRQS